jgi:prepilin-type N-terminal cleavage/methylation domain-containing protein
MNKKAFTLLELVFVIVVLGILAALAIPRLDSDIRQRAGDNILSAIRFTQQMALMDDVTDPRYNNNWQRAFWRLGFQGCSDNGLFYTISSDKNRGGNIDAGEEAVDPLNGKPYNGDNTKPCEQDLTGQNGSRSIYLTKQFGISDSNGITFESNCGSVTSKYIGFDHMGRPHRGFTSSASPDFSTRLYKDCTITFKFDDTSIEDLQITIEKQTGYAYIVGQSDS